MKKAYIFTAILFALSVTLSSAQVKVEKSQSETKKATITKVQKEKPQNLKSSTSVNDAITSRKKLKSLEANAISLDIESTSASQKKIEAKRKENAKKSAEARAARNKKTAALQKRLEKRNAKNNN